MCAWLSRITATIRKNQLYPLVATIHWLGRSRVIICKQPLNPLNFKSLLGAYLLSILLNVVTEYSVSCRLAMFILPYTKTSVFLKCIEELIKMWLYDFLTMTWPSIRRWLKCKFKKKYNFFFMYINNIGSIADSHQIRLLTNIDYCTQFHIRNQYHN